MTNTHGGYRKPANPAPVSGPGAHSRRTDGGPAQVMSAAPGQDYGDKKAQLDAQRVAPMGGATPLPPSASAAPGGGAGAGMPAYQGVPFGGPSQRPDEPVTHGVDIGPGGGSEVLNLPQQPGAPMPTGYLTNILAQMSPNDTTGTLGKLYVIAKQRGV